jgi:bacillithiol system protein YtxJ
MPDPRRIETRDELDGIFRESALRPVFLLKHSTRCGASAAAWRDFRDFAAAHEAAPVGWAVLEIPERRELAEEVAQRTGVPHESPQILLLRDGIAAWHASRWRISGTALARALERAHAP